MNLSAIFSKTGKGVQEASGKTSHLSRADRGVLKEIDGKTSLANIAAKFEKIPADKFDALIQQLDKDGFIREVSSGAAQSAAPAARPAAAAPRAAPPSEDGGDEALDFTQALKLPPKAPAAPPKAPPVDLAAAARAEAERKAKEQQAFDYKGRQEAEAKAKAEAKAREAAEAKGRADAEAKARADAEARARAEAEAKTRAETDAKVKSARDAAVRMATEAKAKTEAAEERARKEAEDKARLEAELKGKLEEERKAREEAERRAREAAEQARKEAEEKAKREAEELRQRLEAEMKAKLEEERRAREEEDRKRREEDERRRKEDEERRAKQEAERRAREEEDRKRREEDERRRKEEAERRAKEEAERRARDEEERKRRKEDEERRAKEEAERRAKEDSERRARNEEDRRRRDEEERKRREDDERRRREDAERTAKEEAEARARVSQTASQPAVPVPPAPAAAVPPPAAAASGGIGDSLLADLDSFTQRDEDERKATEEAERKAKEEAERKAKEEAERRAREEAEKKRREEEERRRKEDAERRAREEEEQRAREEEERQKHEEAERKRKAKEALAAKQAEQKAAARAAGGDDDIGVTEDDLDMDDVKRDEKKLGAEARKAARERERAAGRMGKDEPVVAAAVRRPVKWGKPAAIGLFVALVGGIGALQVMPISTAEYEKAASEALGAPVKIGSARLSVLTGVELNFERVSVGDAVKIRLVRGYPEIGSLFGDNKAFSRLELEGASLSQGQLGDAVLGKASGANFRVGRILIKQAKLDGPLTLPALDVEATVSGDGTLQSVTLRGADKFSVQLSPKGSEIAFEIGAGSLALPFVPALTLSDFGMKGTATRQGVSASTFDGRAYDGVVSGTARIRWGEGWSAEGEVRVRAVNAAVFAPALVSEGKVEGRGAYSMSGAAPSRLYEGARLEGNFKIEKGVLGSFDLTRALQTGGQQSSGRTLFAELNGQGVYDKGTVQLRNIALSAGAMNAGASLDVDANGGLAGRIAADVKTPNQTLRATLNISGKVQDPVIRK